MLPTSYHVISCSLIVSEVSLPGHREGLIFVADSIMHLSGHLHAPGVFTPGTSQVLLCW